MHHIVKDIITLWFCVTGPLTLWCMISRMTLCECKMHWWCVVCLFNRYVLRINSYE
jgi:hypothetical protein